VEKVTSKFALVIANTEYQDANFAKLTAPGKDAEEFAQVLQDPELAAFDDVQVLLNEGEGKTRRAIARFFAERKPVDLLLLYFSGHGVRNEQGQLFLAANDTEISILDATGVPAEFITRAMNNSRSQRQLLILDCCNSGAFAHGSKAASGVGKSMGIATAFEGDGYGRVVLTATDATQYAWEGDKVIGDTQKSVFTHFLIEGLKGEADSNGDGRIHVDELYDYAYEQIVGRTPKQTPGKWSYRQQGDLVLRENLKPRDVKPAVLPSELLEMLSHPNSGVRRAGVQELISLLEGKHLGLARAAQEKLHEISQSDDSLTLRKTAGETLIAHGIMPEQVVQPPTEEHFTTRSVSLGIPKKEQAKKKENEKAAITAPDQRSIATNSNVRLTGGIAVGVLVIGLLVWGGLKFFQNLSTPTAEPTYTVEESVPIASQPSATIATQTGKTDTPSPTRTGVPLTQTAVAPTSEPGVGSTRISEKDGMTLLYVPAGEFKSGSSGELSPAIDAFWIDKTEVTNAMYARCVQDGKCNPPSSQASMTRGSYYGNSQFANYPVIRVTFGSAKNYCSWANRRLPRGTEWEKAARGTDGRRYPWGNDGPSDNLLNYNSKVGDTTEVGQYPNGASLYGALDMSGNVSEWVGMRRSEYSGAYYDYCFGDYDEDCVVRGGAWDSDAFHTYTYVVSNIPPHSALNYIGFRCAMNAVP
jgi:formylglycine-generating enzyme required for sulfatase activity/uncharacterized caspase-like protein